MRTLYFILFLFLSLQAFTQDRKLNAWVDRSVYITGERIWITGFSTVTDQPVHVLLADRQGMIHAHNQVNINKGSFTSQIQLSGELGSDHYAIIITIRGSEASVIPIALINPVKPPKPDAGEISFVPKKDGQLKPVIGKEEYLPREKISVQVPAGHKGNFAVVVARKDGLSDFVDSVLAGYKTPSLKIQGIAKAGEGHRIKAKLTSVNPGDNTAGVRVFASVMGNQANIATELTNHEGVAELILPFTYMENSLVISAQPANGRKYKINVIEEPITLEGNLDLPPLQLDARFSDDINERVINAEVNNKFLSESRTRFNITGLDTTDFYGKPDKRYMLDNYTRIPDMSEILYEFVTEARVRRTEAKPAIVIYNLPFKTFFDLPALVLLDGVPVYDIAQLLTLDPLNLSSVDVVARKFIMGDLQIPGILHYKSYKGDLAGYKLSEQDLVYTFKGYELNTEPRFPVYDGLSDTRIPDFRNLVYWRALEPASGPVEFYAPDGEGLYTVKLIGQEDGALLVGEIYFKVK